MGGEGREHFALLALRYLEEVQGPSELRCDLIEFCGEIRRSRWASSRLSGVVPGLVAVYWKGHRNVTDPQRPHELEAGQPSQVLGVPFPQLGVLGLLADDGIFTTASLK